MDNGGVALVSDYSLTHADVGTGTAPRTKELLRGLPLLNVGFCHIHSGVPTPSDGIGQKVARSD